MRPSSASGSPRRSSSSLARPRRPRPGLPPQEPREMTAMIEARGLKKYYGSTHAVDGVSFTIAAGRIVGLIGPNGAGKTTVLKAILGLTRFDGELKVLGLSP